MDLEKFWDEARRGEPGAHAVLSDYLQETKLRGYFQRYSTAVQVMSTERRRLGNVSPASPVIGHYIYVELKRRVVLFGLDAKYAAGGSRTFVEHEKIFRLGDEAEYGSYNLHYTGTITAIGKRIVIADGRNHSLDYWNFDFHNYRFDAAEIRRKNDDTMMHI